MKRNEGSLKDFWDNELTNIHIIGGFRRRRQRERGREYIEDIIAENFPNLGKKKQTFRFRKHRTPNRINPKLTTLRHNVIKMVKIEERILKATSYI